MAIERVAAAAARLATPALKGCVLVRRPSQAVELVHDLEEVPLIVEVDSDEGRELTAVSSALLEARERTSLAFTICALLTSRTLSVIQGREGPAFVDRRQTPRAMSAGVHAPPCSWSG